MGFLRAWECFWGALGCLWLQNSLSAQNRIIRSNLKNTINDKYDTMYNTPTPYDPSLVRNVHLEMDSKVMYVLLEVDSRVMHLSQSCILANEF